MRSGSSTLASREDKNLPIRQSMIAMMHMRIGVPTTRHARGSDTNSGGNDSATRVRSSSQGRVGPYKDNQRVCGSDTNI